MKDPDMIYAVIDTNVLVSALLTSTSSSNPFIVLNAIYNKKVIPIFNEIILSEYRDVLSRPKFHLSPKQVEGVLNFIISNGVSKIPVPLEGIVFPDPKDIVFYEVRMAVDDSYLVTGNTKHYPIKPFVVTPTRMVEILREKDLI